MLATLSGFGTASAGVTFRPLASPLVCPAFYEPSGADYWGDYFSLLAVPPVPGNPSWRHLAIFSGDEGLACDPKHDLQGRHLHVEASGWAD